MYVERDLCKELTHAVMEVGKSQNLEDELVGWRPRRDDDVVPVLSPKADRLETKEELMFQFESEGRKTTLTLWG